MVLLGEDAQVKARFGLFGHNACWAFLTSLPKVDLVF